MGYMHIDNLYKNQTILMFRECYALEKIHGTSAHIGIAVGEPGNYDGARVSYASGGAKHETFKAIFNETDLLERFGKLGHLEIMLFGEAYGGKMQGMREVYGDSLKFIVFDVKIVDTWLAVPDAADVASKLGLDFVHWERLPADLETLNRFRDMPSQQAIRNGCGQDKKGEGAVFRPLLEMRDNRGNRIICKHKREDFSERTSKKDTVVDPAKAQVLADAEAIAFEWVTPMRLTHVLDKIKAELVCELDISHTKTVVAKMVEDVMREGAGEIVDSKEARRAIGSAAAKMFTSQMRVVHVDL